MAKLSTAVRKQIPKKEFGLPGERAYPMPDRSHAANAKARASQQVAAVLARSFRRGVELADETEPQSYRRRLFGSARGLRRKLADPAVEWRVFEQPG